MSDNGNEGSTIPLVELRIVKQQIKAITNTAHEKSVICMDLLFHLEVILLLESCKQTLHLVNNTDLQIILSRQVY